MAENIVYNDVWGVDIAVEMTFLAIASFAAIWAFFSYREGKIRDAIVGSLVGAVLPIFSLIILNLHLLKPEAAYLIFASPQPRSWMFYGGIGMPALIASSGALAVLLLASSGRLPLSVLANLAEKRSLMNLIGIVIVASGVFVSMYTGLLISYERGIAFWHSAAMPLIGLFMGIVGGSAVFALLRPDDWRISASLSASLFLLVASFLSHLMVSLYGTPATYEAASSILSSGLFQATLVLSIVAIVTSGLNVFYKNRYLIAVAAIIGLASIFVIRLFILSYGAWEYPVL